MISPLVQRFGSGITQFLNPEILSFHLMYDAACSTASFSLSQNQVLCCYTNTVYQCDVGLRFIYDFPSLDSYPCMNICMSA